MISSAQNVAVFVTMVTVCAAQEGGMFRSLLPLMLQGGQLPQSSMLGYMPFSPWGLGGSGQNEPPDAPTLFGQNSFLPFGLLSLQGASGQAGESGGTEGAANTEAATEPGEGPSSQQPSLLDLQTMWLWNQLLGAQMPQQAPPQVPYRREAPPTQTAPSVQDNGHRSSQSALTDPTPAENPTQDAQSSYSDLNLLPLFFMQY